MTDSNAKGDRGERELVNWLDADGWTVIRAPASGSATTRDLPDVLAADDGTFIATEVKLSGGDPIYLDSEEVQSLVNFARDFGADARVAVKFDLEPDDFAYGEDHPGFYLLSVDDLHETPGGNYRVKKQTALEVGTPEVEL